jgi:hypothetical protein
MAGRGFSGFWRFGSRSVDAPPGNRLMDAALASHTALFQRAVIDASAAYLPIGSPAFCQGRATGCHDPLYPDVALASSFRVGRVGADGRKVGHSLSKGLVALSKRVIADPTNSGVNFSMDLVTLTPNLGRRIVAGRCLCSRWTGGTATVKSVRFQSRLTRSPG